MSVDSRLLQLLVCPVCKGPLKANRSAEEAPGITEVGTSPSSADTSERSGANSSRAQATSPAVSWTLVCPADRLAFLVRDGIAVMIESEAQAMAPS